ncbi:MAG TPA: DUF1385 domain-containing protein [Armatimonadota bacterium]|jgi:uncharacterized protein YqhQ
MGKPVFYGGQAVIEGVMMRGPRHVAVAVRRADGSIDTVVKDAIPWLTQHKAFNKPFIRGAFALFDSMRVGVWGLRWSVSRAMLDTPEAKPEEPEADTAVKGTMGVGLLIGVGLFIVVPTLLAGLARRRLDGLGLNLVEGAIRLALFFLYVWGIGHMSAIRRVFQFHGAEHRTINAMEAGAPLTPEGVRPYSVVHPRCGTSFAIFVLLLATVVYAFFGWHTPIVRLLIRLALLPVISGAAYELLRLAGTFRRNGLLNAITWPGRFSQRFTTREPDDAQAEVALAALHAVFSAENSRELV